MSESHYEVHLHAFYREVDRHGTQIQTCSNPGDPVHGWSVYVREYEDALDDQWDEAYDEDFDDYDEALLMAETLAQIYNCGIDEY